MRFQELKLVGEKEVQYTYYLFYVSVFYIWKNLPRWMTSLFPVASFACVSHDINVIL